MFNMDLSLFKTLAFEKVKLQLRGEAFSVLNHPNFSLPRTTLGTSTFGLISATANDSRLVQVGMKVIS